MMVRLSKTLKILFTSSLLLFWSGCLLDFDQFGEGDVGDAGPENQTTEDTSLPDADDDTGPEVDAGENQPQVDPGEFGALCETDEDCDSPGFCRSGICLLKCETNDDCPSDSWCLRFGTEELCAPRCSDRNHCDQFTHRDDLSCVYAVQTRALGAPSASVARACLPDNAGDGVFDLIDNCPDTQNAPQTDSVGDGLGDACAVQPRCHKDSVDGVLEFDSITFRPGSFALPPFVDGPYLAVLGTRDADGAPDSPLHLLDRRTGEWTDLGPLRHAGGHRMILPDNRGGFLISPGVRDESGLPIGSWAHLEQNGTLGFGPQHTFSGVPPVAMTRFSTGEIRRIGVSNATGLSFNARLTILNASQGALTFSEGLFQNASSLGGLESENPENWQSLLFPDGSAGFAFLEPGSQRVTLFDVPHPSSRNGSGYMRTLTIPTTWIDPDDLPDPTDPNAPAPDSEDLSNFAPVVVPALGNQIYVFDRNTGRAGRFLGTWSGLNSRSYGSFERLPEYDVDWFQDFDEFHIYYLPRGAGFGIVGRVSGDEDSLFVREIYFSCHPIAGNLDTDEDGIGDLIDNCPLDENPDQADLDGDGLGDACDPDIDGDFIDNSQDNETLDTGEVDQAGFPIFETIDLSRDSTNDGIDNVDSSDSDGDGIPDHLDPFPLDSSNNGIPNRWTADASGNGTADTTLRTMELNPYNYFSLPASDEFAFFTEAASGQRTLHVGNLSDARNTRATNLAANINPHHLSHSADGRYLVFLNDAPEETERFSVYDLIDDEILTSQPVYAPLRSVTMIDEETFLAVHEIDNSGLWQVSRVTADPNFSRTALFSDLPYIWDAAIEGDFLYLLAAETDCRECAGVYRYNLETNTFETYPIGPEPVLAIAPQGGSVSVLQEGSINDQRFWFRHAYSSTASFQRTIPADFHQVYDISFSLRRNTSGAVLPTAEPFTLVAMSRWGQTPDLWLYNPLNAQWRILLASSSSIVEVSWAP